MPCREEHRQEWTAGGIDGLSYEDLAYLLALAGFIPLRVRS
jgi:hypothetical protein